MNVLAFSFNAIAPMVFTTALGAFMAKQVKAKESDIAFLNTLCFRYLLAFHIFNSTLSIDYHAEFNLKLVVFCVAAIVGTLAAAWLLLPHLVRDKMRCCIFVVSSFRSSNIVYALSLSIAMFGATGMKAAAMLVPVTIICFNFFSVVVMVFYARSPSGGRGAALLRTAVDTAKNPLIIASVLGIALSLGHVELPPFLKSAIGALGNAGTPVTFLLLGAQIDLEKLRSSFGAALGVCVLRLVVVPAILVPLAVAVGFRGPELGALMVVFAAPCAITTLVMARDYDIDPAFTAETVYLSTVLSMPTMFVFITVMRYLGLF
jgi:predicted permease